MHPIIYLNKVMLEATKARVAPVSSAMFTGAAFSPPSRFTTASHSVGPNIGGV